MATELPRTQVVVIGLGAVGGVAVLPLVNAGIRVTGLEAGSWLSTRDFAPDELRNNIRDWPQSVGKAKQEIPTVRPDDSSVATQGSGHPMMNAVGGTSLHYWAQSWRLNPWDFKVVSETTRRYGVERLPKDSTVEDWPLSYTDLEPFYDRVEHAVGVSGYAGNVKGTILPQGNRFEGARSREYPMPGLRSSGFTDMMSDAARKLGWHPFQAPAAINSEVYGQRPGCFYHGFCDRGGCHVSAKGSTAVTTIPEAMKSGLLTVTTHARVLRIDNDANGRATGVTYTRGGETFFQPADVVLLASHTYENSRLLLLSTSSEFPRGLANNAEQVGKHYFSHHQGAPVLALFPHNLNNWYGLPAQGVAIDEWADDNFDHSSLDFIGGGNLWAHTDRKPIAAGKMSTFGKAPTWGKEWKAFLMKNADRYNVSYIQKTTLPYEGNYLDLDPDVKDALGLPVLRITARYRENELKIAAFTQDKMEEWYRAAGATDIIRAGLGNTMGASTHAYGGTRMGDRASTNVVDRFGFAHEVPNLGILGASVMGTSGARNPTLTAQALAWRTVSHLLQHWQSIVG
ncbi:MAG: GMC family oxidoreductase [Pseudomonadales bacterium]|nr:GMC family oxidoreductase [Pseudomonadales bacterium]MCP5358052.1 GMC family oxidoreductase [Pseudomonadales bacterium]